ncbi:uncharacterized protein LOC110425400 [Herrania umbratica]|uniref:Uncharacterized protein LOC110425400 n=1 Tax=Herrania umbratica TaxID=108875 RepID=A0A6J1BC44_9ROSI|nr:uncharacterized protein LOC110425400 [Herrania umbratica]XP_021295979.1 uncharacterized protein LOC110425400 [Herrania umbratica]
MWVNHLTKFSFLKLIPNLLLSLLSECFASSAVSRFRSIALELKGILPVSKLLNNSDAWVTILFKKLAMWWPWVRQIFAIGYATFMLLMRLFYLVISFHWQDKLLTSKIVAEVAIRKSIDTNAISVVEKFQNINMTMPLMRL